jgi:hypothetical protein
MPYGAGLSSKDQGSALAVGHSAEAGKEEAEAVAQSPRGADQGIELILSLSMHNSSIETSASSRIETSRLDALACCSIDMCNMYVSRQRYISSSVAEIESAAGSQGDCCQEYQQKDDCGADAAGRKADGAERDHPEKALIANTSSLPVYVVTEHHQCLVVSALTDEDIKVQVILDTGASTSLVGKGFLEKRESKNLRPLQIEELPRKFQITGVSSNSPVNCKGTVEFGLKFSGESKGTLRFRALVVTEWEGDIILSWNALDMMGINFIRDKETGRTTHVQLSKVDTVTPVVRKYNKGIAEKARQLAAEIDRAVQEDTREALKNRIIFGETCKPKDRRERSRLVETRD